MQLTPFFAALSMFATAGAPAAADVSVTTTASAVSQYMFRGLRLSDAALQPAVELGSANLVLGVWGSVPVNGDKVPDSSDPEFQFYGWYNHALKNGISLTPGFTVYHFPKAPTEAGFYRARFEPHVGVSYTARGARLTARVYYDFELKGPTYELGAFYALPLKTIGSELDFTATYGGYKWTAAANHAPSDLKAWGKYWQIGVALPFQLSPTSKLTAGLAYTEGVNAFTKAGSLGRMPNPLAASRGVVTLSYARSF
jgi:hypothetical protein